MRPAAPLSLALVMFASCASTEPVDDWRRIQRDRIDRMHRVRSLDDALQAVLARSPAVEPEPAPEAMSTNQEPVPQSPEEQHIDQRLPQAPGSGPRRYQHPWQPLVATVQLGLGEISARAKGSGLSDEADAWFIRGAIDTGTGAALHAEVWSTDDMLFNDRFINDGVAPAAADADLSGIDVFPHVRFDNRLGDIRIPVRLGLFTDWQQIDHQSADVEREFLSAGPRLVIEPTWRFIDGQDGNVELFTRFGGDVGPAWFTEEYRNGDGRDSTVRWAGELAGGLRGQYGALHAELGYRVHHTLFDDIDSPLYGNRDSTNIQRQQVFVGFGFTY